jgi:DNA ligase-1
MIKGLRKGGFGVLLSILDGKPAGLKGFMPSATRKELYKMQQVVSENEICVFIEPV